MGRAAQHRVVQRILAAQCAFMSTPADWALAVNRQRGHKAHHAPALLTPTHRRHPPPHLVGDDVGLQHALRQAGGAEEQLAQAAAEAAARGLPSLPAASRHISDIVVDKHQGVRQRAQLLHGEWEGRVGAS